LSDHPEPSADRPAFEIADEQSQLRVLFGLLINRKWAALTTLVLCVTLGILYTIRAPRIYRSSSLVLIEQAAPTVLGRDVEEVQALGQRGWALQHYFKTQYEIITGRPVMTRAAEKLNLFALPERMKDIGQESLEATLAQDPLYDLPDDLQRQLVLLGMDRLPSREKIRAVLQDYDFSSALLGKLTITPVKESFLVQISADTRHPQTSAEVANAVADAYVEINLENYATTTSAAESWLSDQVDDLKRKLQSDEQALQDYSEAHDIVSVSLQDRQSMATDTLSKLNDRLSDVIAGRIEKESEHNHLRELRGKGVDLSSLHDFTSPALADIKHTLLQLAKEENSLRTRYLAAHPAMKTIATQREQLQVALQQEILLRMTDVENQLQVLRETEQRLQDQMATVKVEALAFNQRAMEVGRLQRETQNTTNLYNMILKRQKEVRLTQMLKVNNVSKLEAALPAGMPIKPRTRLILLLAVFMGVVGGIAAAVARDFLDNSIKSPQQLQTILRLPFLGILPTIKDSDLQLPEGEKPSEYAFDHIPSYRSRSRVLECARTIRTNLLFMSPEKPAKSLIVTSTGPREGKSTATIIMSTTMAMSGQKTIIVDTDMRRPRVGKSFGLSSDNGLTRVILGEQSLDEAITLSDVLNLSVLPCGPIPPNPADLLHTEAFVRVVEELRRRYDRIVFDTPPVNVVTDALILAPSVDGVVFIVKASETRLQEAYEAVRRLHDVGGRILGSVLNNVDLDKGQSSSYRYPSHYHYYYYNRSGYYTDDATRGDEQVRAVS
jgi:capsular exopolysaccharide synthesis family protein